MSKQAVYWSCRRAARGQILLILPLALVLAAPAAAKMYEEPRSFSLQVAESNVQVDRKVVEAPDAERLIGEDFNSGKPGPLRFAVATDVAFNLENAGSWLKVSDGQIWRLRVQSPGAKSLNLAFTRFEMPEGAKLWIYDPRHKHVEGPYTSRNRSPAGTLWTPIIDGDEIDVELFVPTATTRPDLQIGKANRAYRSFEKSSGVQNSGSVGVFEGVIADDAEGHCEIDMVCPEGKPWSDQARAVALYTIQGMEACTGTLLNNTKRDRSPILLTADHCGVNDPSAAASMVVYWNFQSPSCGSHGPGNSADNQTGGATILARSAISDFLLLRLGSEPDPDYHVFYSGWDAAALTAPSAVTIHHPEDDVKAITLSAGPPKATDIGYDFAEVAPATGTGTHWRVDWALGVTEPGSSGACLFASDTRRCIGQLHGGPGQCYRGPTLMHDYFGKLSVSWTGGGTPATRLRDWLDSGGTGAMAMDGSD